MQQTAELPPSPHVTAVAYNVFLGCLKAMRNPDIVCRFDAVLNLSNKTAYPTITKVPYCAILLDDVNDTTVMLPKLIYAARWLVDQVSESRWRRARHFDVVL
jgi:hypothetical protein